MAAIYIHLRVGIATSVSDEILSFAPCRIRAYFPPFLNNPLGHAIELDFHRCAPRKGVVTKANKTQSILVYWLAILNAFTLISKLFVHFQPCWERRPDR